MAAFLLAVALPAGAAEAPKREVLAFYSSPTITVMGLIHRHARAELAKANAAKRPIDPRVARIGRYVFVRLESVAICDVHTTCPLLVYDDVTKPPLLSTTAMPPVLLETRGAAVTLIVLRPGEIWGCRLTGVVKALCRKP
ncbi:MAG: hypothetical protein HY985_03940 [Magnetospirillum sp.]|nr:hypothetical protein [Magnetospirillum sp.]